MVAGLGMTMRRSVGTSDGCRDVMLLYAQANFSHWILHPGAYLAETWRRKATRQRGNQGNPTPDTVTALRCWSQELHASIVKTGIPCGSGTICTVSSIFPGPHSRLQGTLGIVALLYSTKPTTTSHNVHFPRNGCINQGHQRGFSCAYSLTQLRDLIYMRATPNKPGNVQASADACHCRPPIPTH